MVEFQASYSRNIFLLAASRSKGINWSLDNWPEEAQMGSSLELDSSEPEEGQSQERVGDGTV